MPVQFKGLSEYDRSYKWKSLDSSDQNRRKASRWAGLRSDELGITKEPCFISKRRVPFYNPQISKSFQWEECIDLPRNECAKSDLGTNEPVKLHLELEKESLAEESMHTPDAPRLLKKSSSHSAAHRMQSADGKSPAKNLEIHAQEANKETPTSSKAIPEKYDNGSHRVLQKKAGLNITPLQHPLKMSEYKRQYERKNPAENSPMLAAEQIVYNKNKLVPPFKVNSVKTQTEYESQFKGSPPAKGPKLRKDWEEKHISEYEPENQPPKRKDKKKKINEASSSPPKMDKSEEEQEQMIQRKILKEKVLQQLNHFSKSCRKMKSEYSANFLSPSEYKYKDGAWVRIKQKGHDQGSSLSQGSMWLAEATPSCIVGAVCQSENIYLRFMDFKKLTTDEDCRDFFNNLFSARGVKELREKAEYYRRRAQGTHFSREHLNQILSVNNRLWDVSSNCSSEEHVSNNIKALDLAGLQTSSKNEQMHTSPAETKSASNTGNLGDSNVPTMPVRRRLVWGENVMEPTRELEPQKMENEIEEEKCTKEMDNLEETEQLEHADNIEEKGTERLHGTEFNPSVDGSDCTSLSSETGGRLPTPKFKSSGLALRTHHDRTTPSTGGALLVSPMKQQPQTSEEMQKSYYEKNSQNKHVSKEHIKIKEKEQSTQSPLVAGMRTVDPIPLREDPWPSNHIFNGPSSPVITYPVSRSSVQKPTVSMLQQWSPSCRIHGALKDPEFQHNGNFANPNLYKISLDVDHSIEDDRLSQISARSAASSSLASQVLERAQKRKEHFWGKK